MFRLFLYNCIIDGIPKEIEYPLAIEFTLWFVLTIKTEIDV